jgi:hypothetical protein
VSKSIDVAQETYLHYVTALDKGFDVVAISGQINGGSECLSSNKFSLAGDDWAALRDDRCCATARSRSIANEGVSPTARGVVGSCSLEAVRGWQTLAAAMFERFAREFRAGSSRDATWPQACRRARFQSLTARCGEFRAVEMKTLPDI